MKKHYIVKDDELQITCVSDGVHVIGKYTVHGKELFIDDNRKSADGFNDFMNTRTKDEQVRWIRILGMVLEQLQAEYKSTPV